MGRLFRYGRGTAQGCFWIILHSILIITVWKKVLAGFTASFLVITNATVVNLSNNLAMSNVWIVFAFKRRFSRCWKKKNRKKNCYCGFYIHNKISTRYFLGEGFDITSWQPLPARVGRGVARWLANKKDWDDRRTRLLARMKKKKNSASAKQKSHAG